MRTAMDDPTLRYSLIISASLHVVALLLLYFGLPNLFRPPPPEEWRPIPFEIVDIGAITNTRVQKEPEEPKEPPKPPAPKAEQKPVKAEAKPPEPPKPPEPVKQETPPEKAPDKPAEVALPKPKDKPKPPEPPKPPAQPQDQLASVLKNVAKLKPAVQAKDDTKAPAQNTPAETKSLAPSLSDRLTISDEDALRRQLSLCWNMPVGARDAENLIVEVLITVNQDRTVANAEIVDRARYSTDGFFRAAADAAIRAVRHPNCTPLQLPADKYEQWKTIRFFFDPRDML